MITGKGALLRKSFDIKLKDFIFYTLYFMFYISLFMGDIYDEAGTLSEVAKVIRLVVYIFIIFQVLFFKLNKNAWTTFVIFFVLSVGFAVITKDYYWSILILFIYSAREIEPINFVYFNYKLLFIATIVVLGLCLIGVLPDEMTSRNTIVNVSYSRHSFGFYHSNVLPLIVLYLESYYVFINKENCKNIKIISFIIIAFLVNIMCNSRNAFGLVLFLSIMTILLKKVKIAIFKINILKVISKYSILLYSIFSYAMMYLLLRGGIWDKIDSTFSGRFRLGIFKARSVGIHILNVMSTEDFFKDGIVCDNGYIYITLRYGLIFMIFYTIIAYCLTQKARNNQIILLVFSVIFFANFIDNDLVDYSMLPFILLSFNNKSFFKSDNI